MDRIEKKKIKIQLKKCKFEHFEPIIMYLLFYCFWIVFYIVVELFCVLFKLDIFFLIQNIIHQRNKQDLGVVPLFC